MLLGPPVLNYNNNPVKFMSCYMFPISDILTEGKYQVNWFLGRQARKYNDSPYNEYIHCK